MISQRPDQPEPHDSLCLRHQEGNIQCIPLQVGQELQGDRCVVPPIRTNDSVKYLSILVPTCHPTELSYFRCRKRRRSALNRPRRRGRRRRALRCELQCGRSRTATALQCPPGRRVLGYKRRIPAVSRSSRWPAITMHRGWQGRQVMHGAVSHRLCPGPRRRLPCPGVGGVGISYMNRSVTGCVPILGGSLQWGWQGRHFIHGPFWLGTAQGPESTMLSPESTRGARIHANNSRVHWCSSRHQLRCQIGTTR